MEIIIVDDDPTTRLLLGSVLRKLGYEVVQATDGLEAQEILRQRPISLILCDWNMSGMDGIELCRWIRSASFAHYSYFILLTGRNDKRSLIEGMEAGADDFLVKPIDADELKVRLRAGERVLLLQQQLAERNRALESLNKELQQQYDNLCRDLDAASKIYTNLCQDIQAAAKLQKSLLPPPASIGEFRGDWLFLPAAMLAGDMFGYFLLDEQHLAFFQIDVAGHGVPSALFSFSVSQTLTPAKDAYGFLKRPLSKPPFYTLTSPATVARELNRHFASKDDTEIYFTLVYGYLDRETGEGVLVQAGHPHPLLWRGQSRTIERLGDGGFAVGMLPGLEYDSVPFELTHGDRLFIYSDGIVECASPAGELYGLQRLERFLAETALKPTGQVIDALRAELTEWRQCPEFDDDISLLILDRSVS